MSKLRILSSVPGVTGRFNDVIFSPHHKSNHHFKGSVVFFPGDVQDLKDVQAKHRDNSRHISWCLEETADLLSKAFPARNIFLIRPARKQLRTFSCFDNFVNCDNMGNPTAYVDNYESLEHLAKLLVSLSSELECQIGPLTVIGFSKGVVVLNQFVRELAHYKDASKALNQILDLERFVWLDGGHNGGPGTIYITDPKILKKFVEYGIDVNVRLTPYQDLDSRRPWIHKECKTFVRNLIQMTSGSKGQGMTTTSIRSSEGQIITSDLNRSTASEGQIVTSDLRSQLEYQTKASFPKRSLNDEPMTFDYRRSKVLKKLYFEDEVPSIETHFNIIKTLFHDMDWDS